MAQNPPTGVVCSAGVVEACCCLVSLIQLPATAIGTLKVALRSRTVDPDTILIQADNGHSALIMCSGHSLGNAPGSVFISRTPSSPAVIALSSPPPSPPAAASPGRAARSRSPWRCLPRRSPVVAPPDPSDTSLKISCGADCVRTYEHEAAPSDEEGVPRWRLLESLRLGLNGQRDLRPQAIPQVKHPQKPCAVL